MCKACKELPQLVALAELERLVRVSELEHVAELAGGFTIPDAVRDLLPHERAAKVKFGDMFALMSKGYDDLNAALASLAVIARRELLGALAGGELLEVVARVRAIQPEAMVLAEDQATDAIEVILGDLYRAASATVIGEARRQGVTVTGLKPHNPPADTFTNMARTLAMAPWSGLLSEFQLRVFSPSAEVSELATKPKHPVNKRVPRPKVSAVPIHLRDAADAALAKMMDTLAEVVKQDVHIAHGRGRARTARKFNPGDIFASELLDKATCSKCRAIDGKEYDSFAAARKDYPEGRPYVNCLGGARCRGTLVFLYNEPTEWDAP